MDEKPHVEQFKIDVVETKPFKITANWSIPSEEEFDRAVLQNEIYIIERERRDRKKQK